MKHTKELAEAICAAFSVGELTRLVYHTFTRELKDVANVAQPYPDVVYDLLRWCDRTYNVGDLTLAACEENARNPKLRAIASKLKPAVAPYHADDFDLTAWRRLRAETDEQLESIVLKNVSFQDVRMWLERLGSLFRSVCRVEPQQDNTMGYGSAFLIENDVIMTNDHVVRGFLSKQAETLFRFDYVLNSDGIAISKGRTTKLAQDWDILRDEELDFALVRLAEPVGTDGDGRQLIFVATPALADSDPLLVLQHPDALPLKLSFGSVTQAAKDARISHNANTLGGSSGSPCLTTSLDAFAIHRGGHDGGNTAVPFTAIRTYFSRPEQKARLVAAGLANLAT